MNRIIQYSPLESQRRFHKLRTRFKGFSGPVGSGKSQALCQEAIVLAYVNPGCLGLIGAPTFPMLRDATQITLMSALEESGIPFDLNKAENTLTIQETGSKILLRSMDDYERLRGTNLAWFGIDELTYTHEEAWIRLEARLRDPNAKRLCGFGVWTPKGFDWVYRRFIRGTTDGYACVLAQARENSYLLDKVPDFYDRLKSSYDEQFYRQEALGEYLNPKSGLVYSSFDRSASLGDLTADPAKPLLWALDFNVNPMCSIIAQRIGDEIHVLDEIVLSHAGTLDACDEFVRRYPKWAAGVIVYADASANAMQTAGTNDTGMLKDFFASDGRHTTTFKIPKSNPSVQSRVRLVNGMLKSASDETRIRVDSRCKELIADFDEVSWARESMDIDKSSDSRRTHLSDALGYLLWQEFPTHVKTIGFRGQKLVA
jgi:hypothetical protein